jgi:fibro-slime domain-containing protein
MRFLRPLWLILVVAPWITGACAGVKSDADASAVVMVGTDSSTSPVVDAVGRPDRTATTVPPICGNRERTSDEACDDGNTVSGDGCAADCKTVESGYSCVPVGVPCHRIARCGDGVVVLPELCDDGNQTAGDGCSATCKVEVGFKCSGNPSACTATHCGDKIVEGAESCDDGNAIPFDGCSADCQSEPGCTGGACVSRCGDGIVVGEACDDGNNLDGDGCSATCAIEPGFECHQPALGDKMLVPIIYRDFRLHNPADFEPGATGRNAALPGIVMPTLDADGKPVYTGIANSLITSQATFSQWYRDVPGVNHATISKLPLWNNGNGGYVNRYGPNGEPWQKTQVANWCGNVGSELNGAPCTFMFGPTDCQTTMLPMLSCYLDGTTYKGLFLVENIDGSPLFFPVDDDSFTPASERSSASISDLYAQFFMDEPGKPLHNFSFTSEVRYWFQYDATKTYTLDFTGDDDVWLFINKKLAVDLGGIHVPVQGSVTFDATSAARFGLTDGQVYEVAVFQAERQTNGSSYRLTLSGFSAAPSECVPICGDGILGIGEECDDGVNPGGYGQCGPGCKLTEYCGDGIVQAGNEDCDDGVNTGNPCPSGCRILIIP